MRQFCHGHKRKRPAPRRKPLNSVVGRVGIEPTTNGLRVWDKRILNQYIDPPSLAKNRQKAVFFVTFYDLSVES